MRVVIAAPEHDDGSLLVDELHAWLAGDADLHRTAEIRRVARDATGTMGALDVIEVVVGQGVAVLNLALAYASWRSTRPAPPAVTVTVPGGVLTVTDDSPEALELILAALRATPDRQEGTHGDGTA
ncbi:effector-associated constant component EACC1 [Streptomyces galilaeus]